MFVIWDLSFVIVRAESEDKPSRRHETRRRFLR